MSMRAILAGGHRHFSAAAAFAAAVVLFACCFGVHAAHAQTLAQDSLRATIKNAITADPRSQNMTTAQIQTMVNALMVQAQKQGVSAAALSYRATVPAMSSSGAVPVPPVCSGAFCTLSAVFGNAFGLDGSVPVIPIALFIAAILFILIFSFMREMGHPHAMFGMKKDEAQQVAPEPLHS